MGVPREELLSGIPRLLERLGGEGTVVRDGAVSRFRGPAGISIEVGPMPEDRIRYPILFPRTLVVLEGPEEAFASFYREFMQAFLRPTG